MIHPQFLEEVFADSYSAIQHHTKEIRHTESVWQPPFGGNSINWIMGHLVVSRCNFLMLLDVPSIWSMDQCLRFIPGSSPVTEEVDSVPFDSLISAFDQTQEQLMSALEHVSDEVLGQVKGERTVAESLVYYQSHEAEHTGQLELLCRLARF
ncbi:MAG: DinB family protein [Candidatus Promineifilaceae bacterium]